MRINLVTPFAEKDAVKALGARWDATKKLWYVVDVADLTPYLRWIPNLEAATEKPGEVSPPQLKKPKSVAPEQAMASFSTKPVILVPDCGCNVLPWDDCVHTANGGRLVPNLDK